MQKVNAKHIWVLLILLQHIERVYAVRDILMVLVLNIYPGD